MVSWTFRRLFFLRLFLFRGFFVGEARDVRMLPAVDGAAIRGVGVIRKIRGFERELAAGGNVYFQPLVEHDGVGEKFVLKPEFTGGQRRDEPRGNVVFQRISGTQGRHGDVLFLVIGVHGRVGRHRSGQFLHGVRSGGYHRSIGLAHAHEADIHLLVRGVVAEDDLAPLLDARLALHADAHGDFAFARAVVFIPRRCVELLDDEWFPGI